MYRTLGALASAGYLKALREEGVADPRRIPYEITDHGRDAFDRWLANPVNHAGDIVGMVLFLPRMAPQVRHEVLKRSEDDLWKRSKSLARARDNELPGDREHWREAHDPRRLLLRRQLLHVETEIGFLKELREHVDSFDAAAMAQEAPILGGDSARDPPGDVSRRVGRSASRVPPR